MDFNRTKDSYAADVQRAIAFAGQSLDFFTRVKADFLQRIVAQWLPSVARPRLLDIGCGHGYIHPFLLRSGLAVIGTEVAGDVLPQARAANPDAAYVGGDGAALPFPDGAFDAAFTICVLHHVPSPTWARVVAEMYRVLRPGGIGIVFEHNPWNPLTRYVVATNDIDADAELLSERATRQLLRTAGFTAVRSRNILFTPFERPVFRTLDRRLGWLPCGAQYYVVGRRVAAA